MGYIMKNQARIAMGLVASLSAATITPASATDGYDRYALYCSETQAERARKLDKLDPSTTPTFKDSGYRSVLTENGNRVFYTMSIPVDANGKEIMVSSRFRHDDQIFVGYTTNNYPGLKYDDVKDGTCQAFLF